MRVALLDLGCDLSFLIIGHVYPDPDGLAGAMLNTHGHRKLNPWFLQVIRVHMGRPPRTEHAHEVSLSDQGGPVIDL